jgi:hypothetical protein
VVEQLGHVPARDAQAADLAQDGRQLAPVPHDGFALVRAIVLDELEVHVA